MLKLFSLCLLGVFSFANGQSTSTSTEMPADSSYICGMKTLSSSNDIAIALRFDYDAEMVYITMQGPDSQYYAVGFGDTSMDGTYAIVIDGDGSVSERKLGNHAKGTLLTTSVTTESDVTGNSVRTVVLSRAITMSDTDYYSFDTYVADDTLSLIWATADTTSISQHDAKGSTSITFEESTDPDSDSCTLTASTGTTDGTTGGTGTGTGTGGSSSASIYGINSLLVSSLLALVAYVAL